MLDTLSLDAFNIVTNPIIITEPDGSVIYKNQEAQKQLKVPHKYHGILSHLFKSGRRAIKNYREALPAFLDYTAEGETVTAFVDFTYYESRPVILFFFSHLFDLSLMESSRFLTPKRLAEKFSAADVIRHAKDAYTRDDLDEAIKHRPGHLIATRVFKKLFSTALTELYYGGETLLFPLTYANEIMAYAARMILTHFGLDVIFPLLDHEKSDILIDFKPFSLLFSHLLILLAEISDTPSTFVRVCDEDSTVLYEINARIKERGREVIVGGIEAFSRVLPGGALDLYAFDTLCKHQNYRFSFTLKDSEEENLTLRLRVPIERKYVVRENTKTDRARLLALVDRFAALLEA